MKPLFKQTVTLLSLILISFTTVKAQPDYSFKNASLKSGTALTTGAVYKFLNVRPGTDANITILGNTGGVTLTSIDENWTGFDDAFQPFINVAPNANGYVEFRIDFLTNGTENLRNQARVNTSCIDVDGVVYGNGVLYEQDQVEYAGGTYDFSMNGSNLQVLNPPGWVSIRNTTGVSYPGIDTTQKDVMATVTNMNVSSIKIRIGARNTSPTISEVRYRSVYFKKFNYPSSILLPNRTTLSFSGAWKGNAVELKGLLSASHTYDRLIIERGSSSETIMPIGEISLVNTNSADFVFNYLDNSAAPDVNYYRLRMVNTNQQIYELSSIIMVKKSGQTVNDLRLVNTIVNSSNPSLNISSRNEEEAGVQVADMSGRIVYSNKLRLNSGNNLINLNQFNSRNGYFVIVVKTKQSSLSQQIIVQ
ncbi:MAG: T9SS type A sorting domain-containing protein [Bacteroidetes bacterium]|nr:T9SS type A sorting domain-containing protein [Bacteroidota bacterium]